MPKHSALVLVIFDCPILLSETSALFERSNYQVIAGPGIDVAVASLDGREPDLLVTDLTVLQNSRDFILPMTRRQDGLVKIPILVIGEANGRERILEALKAGADDYIGSFSNTEQILARATKLIEKKQAGSLLQETEDYFRSLIENVSDVISILSFDGTIIYESASIEQVLGHRLTDIIGKNAFDYVHPDDRERVKKYFYEHALEFGLSSVPIEYRFRDSDSKWRILESIGKIINDPSKGLIAVVNSRDVTQRHKSEIALRVSEEKFRLVLDNSLDIIYQMNLRTENFDYASRAVKSVTGYEPEEFVNGGFEFTHSLVHPDDFEPLKRSYVEAVAGFAQGVREYSVEYRLNTKHRGYRWIRENRALLGDDAGVPFSIISTARDVTDQKAFEANLHLQKTLLESQSEASIDGIVAVNSTGLMLSHNQRFLEMWGVEREELLGKTICELRDIVIDRVEDEPSLRQKFRELSANEQLIDEDEIRLLDGRTFEVYSVPIKDSDEKHYGRVTFFRDITERRKIEDKLLKSEDNYRDIVENSQEFICTHDLNGNVLSFNKKVREVLGIDDENAQFNMTDILVAPSLEGFPAYLENLKRNGFASGLMHMRNQSGELRILEFNNTLRKEGVDQPIVRGMATDVTERKRAEDNVRESEARFRNLADTAPVWIWIAGTDRNLKYANKTFLDFTGREFNDEVRNAWQSIHPDDLAAARRVYYDAFENKEEYSLEYRHRRFDGEYRWVLLIGVPRWTPNGTFIGYIGSGIDIHERRQAETDLRRTEEQLRQSQKLESVGRLAGGIAHDFNNMLTAIIGYSDITLIKLSPADPLRRNIEEIRKAGERSAALTSQLLAFSRQQVLQPKIVAFNELIAETAKMLRRLIGENIALDVKLDERVGMIEADPAQLTQVVVNLAVNARDAMPNGGTLSTTTEILDYDASLPISADLVKTGKVVLLTVKDSGAGIDPEHLPHVFEPFYTTKEIGKGTGLGLATVYGFVKQSSGEIFVESEPGAGTTFKIYFPCVPTASPTETAGPNANVTKRGTETILIVEDEEMVRELGKTLLEDEGYVVITAKNGREAYDICRDRNGKIDLVISDLVMPEMSGLEFAREIKTLFPKLPILFTSGYTEDKGFLEDLRESDVDFLSKPFVLEALVAKVRDFLDNGAK